MLENVVVALAILLAVVFLVGRLIKTWRQGGCCDLNESRACSCCSECLDCSKRKTIEK